MAFEIVPTETRQVWCIRHSGELHVSEIDAAVSELAFQFEHKPLQGLLIDLSQVTAIANKAEYLSWIEGLPRMPHVATRVAFLASEHVLDEVEFMALACQNRGMAVWVFLDAGEAKSWLTALLQLVASY